MNRPQDLARLIHERSVNESQQDLQARLDAAGKGDTTLNELPVVDVPETFRSQMLRLLENGKSLSLQEIRSITADIDSLGEELHCQERAEKILQGIHQHKNGLIEVVLPVEMTFLEAMEILNGAARERGMPHDLFSLEDRRFWEANESDQRLRLVPGERHFFSLEHDASLERRSDQLKQFGSSVPLAALALAETAERLRSEGTSSFFEPIPGGNTWVRGRTPGALLSVSHRGTVFVLPGVDDESRERTVYAREVLDIEDHLEDGNSSSRVSVA
jgi:hypothetical protein